MAPSQSRRHPESFDCKGCGAEIFGTRRYCEMCLPRENTQPVKFGMVTLAPDGTVTGAIVRRQGEDWHFEANPNG